MAADLYNILETTKGASDAEIKKAYKKLARKYHPDVNKESGAEEKFKEVQKAYSILSNPQKKSQYDQFGVADDSASGQGGGFGGFESGGFDDIFDAFFGGQRGGGRSQGPSRGDDLRYDLEITLEEVADGVEKDIEIYHLASCSPCNGSGSRSKNRNTCGTCHGSGQIKTVQRTFIGSVSQVVTCTSCRGRGTTISDPCSSCSGQGVEKKKKKISVSIPQGVDSGLKLRVSGEGNVGTQGGPAGDLYVFISVSEHTYFVRENDNIIIELTIPFTDLVLGTELEIPILNGKANLKIPEGTQTNTTFRLKGKGVPHLKGYGRGDQYVKVIAELPKKLSSKEKSLVQEFAKIRGYSTKKNNLFDNVKKWF
jgi:molecular chaperone DnaJ